ncbi:MAG: hypothetical protein AAFX87_09055 [Bacteroidota bacterium]
MTKRLIGFTTLLFILLSNVVHAQIDGKYYWYHEGTKKQWDVSEDKIEMADWPLWSEDPQWENPSKRLILQRSGDKILTKEADANYYRVFQFIEKSEYGSIEIFSYPTRKTESEAQNDFKKNEDENLIALFAVPFFNEKDAKKLESKKGLNEITRDELIELLNKREAFGNKIAQMLNGHPDDKRLSSQMTMFRLSQSLFQKEAIKMGFNPYKPLEGNPLKKFRDDEEIQNLMNKPLVGSDN